MNSSLKNVVLLLLLERLVSRTHSRAGCYQSRPIEIHLCGHISSSNLFVFLAFLQREKKNIPFATCYSLTGFLLDGSGGLFSPASAHRGRDDYRDYAPLSLTSFFFFFPPSLFTCTLLCCFFSFFSLSFSLCGKTFGARYQKTIKTKMCNNEILSFILYSPSTHMYSFVCVRV